MIQIKLKYTEKGIYVMNVVKVINNNIVSSVDDSGKEVVVMGKGLGFKQKIGDLIDVNKIEKIFKMETDEASERLQDVLSEVPLERIQITNEIIAYARETINREFNRNIYITLTDHINFAIERYEKKIEFRNALAWEIKRFYPEEYEVGLKALLLIKTKMHMELPEDEASSIAIHFVNAELGNEMPKTIDVTKIIQNVTKIVKYNFNIKMDESTLNYERFITHLKFLAQRIVNNAMNQDDDNDDGEFNQMIQARYGQEYRCAEKIKTYIEKEYDVKVSDEELIYLTIHIRRNTTLKHE